MRIFFLVSWACVALLCSCSASTACNTTTCGGCCDSAGRCQKGTEATACGATGSMCQSCTSAQVCAQHTCQAGSAAGGGTATGGGTASTGGGAATGGGSGTGGAGVTGGGTGAKPPEVNVSAGSCQSVVPCSGDLVGTWFYSVACADDPLADVRKSCAGITTVSSSSKLSGRLDFTATTVTRVVDTTYATTVNLPTSCNTQVGCSVIAKVLQQSVPTASCMAATNGGCDCSLSGSSNLTESGTWTNAAGVLTITTPTKTRTFDSCVMSGIAPTSLRLRETSTTSGTELGTTTLLKQ